MYGEASQPMNSLKVKELHEYLLLAAPVSIMFSKLPYISCWLETGLTHMQAQPWMP